MFTLLTLFAGHIIMAQSVSDHLISSSIPAMSNLFKYKNQFLKMIRVFLVECFIMAFSKCIWDMGLYLKYIHVDF